MQVFVLYLVQLVPSSDAASPTPAPATSPTPSTASKSKLGAAESASPSTLSPPSCHSPAAIHHHVCQMDLHKGASLILLPFHRRRALDVILVDRRPVPSNFFVRFISTAVEIEEKVDKEQMLDKDDLIPISCEQGREHPPTSTHVGQLPISMECREELVTAGENATNVIKMMDDFA